jgi:ABC-type transport system involved in multi-copper enzyme maturation permease subunit
MTVLRAEMMKTTKRWMPYVLFLFAIAGTAVIIGLFGYVAWFNERDEAEAGFGIESFFTFAWPWSLQALLDNGQFYGSVLFVAILTSSSVATEYNWGTARGALIRGQSRTGYLLTKLLGTALICTGFLLAVLAIGVVFSILATAAAHESITLDVPGGPSVPEIGLMIMRAALAILPYGILAFMLAVVGRSTALGVAGAIGYMFVENIATAILREFSGIWNDIPDLLIGTHVSSLIAANRFGNVEYVSFAPRERPIAGELPDPWIAALAIVAWCAVLLGITFFVFLRRDLQTRDV